MNYRLSITRRAEKEIAHLTPKIRRQIIEKILKLEANPRPQDIKQLKGEEDAYRVESGDYRILFHLDDQSKQVIIFRVKHRREVYRNL
ncbi:MAG: type II toxin-antitoxin system RelE/ParE family toxin [Dehalococcoidia bacterium]